MASAIEYFTPEYQRLAVSAATTSVYVDGALCEDLMPVQMVHSSWPEFGWARLTLSGSSQIEFERIEDRFAMGRTVCLRQLHHESPPETSLVGLPIFVGQIEGIETTIDGANETLDILVRDFSAAMDRITVHGQKVRQDDGSVLFMEGLGTIFNPAGRANAARDHASTQGRSWMAFCAGTAQTKPWDYAGLISYLLGAHLPGGALHWPELDQLRVLTGGRIVRDLDVTGLSLLGALRRCCEETGIRFRFVPRLVETGPSQAIVFYRNGENHSIELNCQPAGQTVSLSRANIASLQSKRNLYPITHRYIGQGDFKTCEATFTLVPAWDPTLEETNYYTFSPSTNPDFSEVRDVYRKWSLNEAGDYSGEPFNQGTPYDLSEVFETDRYVARRRRFWPALSKGAHGRSLGYYLEVSYDDGSHWRRYPHAFNNLLDECGLWLSSDQLDVSTWVAALKGVLKFRITASVVSDERLTCIVADGPVGSTAPVVDHVLTLPRRFQYRSVSQQSLFAQTNSQTIDRPDEVDDTAALNDFVRSRAAAPTPTFETIQIQTPALMLHLPPGDRIVSSPDSRDLLNSRRDNRCVVWVERVQINFQEQCTRLSLARRRQS